MANIPENTTNPILRPVTRLETTTKVFGGEYIPDDAQQRGISNLQAIELAERDQYIISRVGQAKVNPSGDIPGQVGIADLDTSGRVPKAHLPSDTVYTDADQTLKYKTIDYQNNKIFNYPKQYPVSSETSVTHNFTKDEDIRINTAPFTLTLGTGSYVGQKVTVYSVQSGSYIIFTTHSGNTVCVGISGGVKVSFTCVNSSAGYWYADSGSVFGIYDSFYGGRPAGTTPSNWKSFYGNGTYTFGAATTKLTEYNLPEGNLNIQVTWRGTVSASAVAESNYYASGTENAVPTTYIRRYYSADGATGWSSAWQQLVTKEGSQTLTNKTIDANSNTFLNTVTSKNITNCITAIPQDINLTLSSGTLTLKAGSKVYVPNGAGVFDVLTTASDRSLTLTSDGQKMICTKSDGSGIIGAAIANCVSGAGATTTNGFAYNTTTNKINLYTTGLQSGDYSFPIAIVTVSGGAISSIDQVFNGMGYIGSTLFVLPGLKALAPNERNADGTLKNTEISITSVRTYTGTQTNSRVLIWTNNLYTNVITQYRYDEDKNIFINTSDNSSVSLVILAIYTATSGVISNFQPKTTFHTVDYSEVMLANQEQTLTNKTIAFADNTLTGVASTSTSQTLTNKTIDANSNDLVNVVTSKNISNCITEIPQDINLTLSSGNLSLKNGSKVYIPNGSGNFDTFTLTGGDISSGDVSFIGVPFMFFVSPARDGLTGMGLDYIFSGTTAPAAPSTGQIWYDTSANSVKRWSGTAWVGGFSLPVGIISAGATSIEQIFNGMGHIGSTIFALPGLKGLRPYGRNSDGSLKSLAFTVSSVKTYQVTSVTGTRDIFIDGSSNIDSIGTGYYVYDDNINYFKYSSGNSIRCLIGTFYATSGVISNFKPKTAFHAVDYNDWQRQIGSGAIKNATVNTTYCDSALSDVSYCVVGRVCYVQCWPISLKAEAGSGSQTVLATGLPKAKMNAAFSTNTISGGGNHLIYINAGDTQIKGNTDATVGDVFGSFSYPVADDYVES